ncbi:MAG: hypothetical protein AB1627_00260 [Chloroflexota bacterium]
MTPRTGREYNETMRRLLAFAAVAWLVLALAPAVLADDSGRDPRCADWEQHGAPAGIDLRLVCTANEVIGTYTGQSEDEINADPLMPYVVGALVTGIALAVVGVVAMKMLGRQAGKRLEPERPDAWWVCPACHSINAEGRPACYACHASRPASTTGSAEPLVMHRAD